MAKHSESQSGAEQTVTDASVTIPTREDGESLMAYAARVKAHKAEERARNVKAGRTVSTSRAKQVDEDAAVDAWTEFQKAIISVGEMADKLNSAGLWSEKEATTVYMLSGVDQDSASQKDVAEFLGCNTWMVFNYRRDALTKLASLIGENWEDLHEPLRMRRGAAKPERHSQYWEKVSDEELARRAEAHKAEVLNRKAQRQAAKLNGGNTK